MKLAIFMYFKDLPKHSHPIYYPRDTVAGNWCSGNLFIYPHGLKHTGRILSAVWGSSVTELMPTAFTII